MKNRSIYLGTFLIAAVTLALQMSLIRILSVVTWHYMAYSGISLALWGMTAGSLHIFLDKKVATQADVIDRMRKGCFWFAITAPLTILFLFYAETASSTTSNALIPFLGLMVTGVAIGMPFYFSGGVIAAVLTRLKAPTNRVYASDLAGSAIACLVTILALNFLKPFPFSLVLSALAIAAGISFRTEQKQDMRLFRFATGVAVAGLFFAVLAGSFIRPLWVKGEFAPETIIEVWNNQSRVAVMPESRDHIPAFWGKSKVAPKNLASDFHLMHIDGCAGTALNKFSLEGLSHFKYDVTNIAHALKRSGTACVIGVGGGRDVQSAVLNGYNKVVGVELNPAFINLHQNEFRGYSKIAEMKNVSLVVDEARSYFVRNPENLSCDFMQMSLIDTFAATSAGAFSLSENALYTVEGWRTFLSRLTPTGIFTVSRWYSPEKLDETGKIVSLAMATLLDLGKENPKRHMALISTEHIATLILSNAPFSDEDLSRLRQTSEEMKFDILISPDQAPGSPLIAAMLDAKDQASLLAAARAQPLNWDPPTDRQPYFFNLVRLSQLEGIPNYEGTLGGNVKASLHLVRLLFVLLVLVLLTVIIPLVFRSAGQRLHQRPGFFAAAGYFSIIGAAFMFTEIALIQKMNIYLGYPTYSIGVSLFTLILGTGVGSFLVEKSPLVRGHQIVLPLTIAVTIAVMCNLLNFIITPTIHLPTIVRMGITFVAIFPVGLLLGHCFPFGMQLIGERLDAAKPWFWGLNGAFGVFASTLAALVSIFVEIDTNFYIASVCYLALALLIPIMKNAASAAPADQRTAA